MSTSICAQIKTSDNFIHILVSIFLTSIQHVPLSSCVILQHNTRGTQSKTPGKKMTCHLAAPWDNLDLIKFYLLCVVLASITVFTTDSISSVTLLPGLTHKRRGPPWFLEAVRATGPLAVHRGRGSLRCQGLGPRSFQSSETVVWAAGRTGRRNGPTWERGRPYRTRWRWHEAGIFVSRFIWSPFEVSFMNWSRNLSQGLM